MLGLILSSLRWRGQQWLRCRRGDHAWRTVAAGRRSDFVACDHCPETGYRIKETPSRG